MNKRSDILLVGQTPPPYHGQAIVTAMLFDHDWKDLEVERLRMAYSDSIDVVGRASLSKIIHLFSLIIMTWWKVISRRPRILYYLPASANRTPVLRDIIYLSCVKWLFPKRVFHYHAGGLPEYLEEAGWLGGIAKLLYSNADLSVEICHTEYSPGRLFNAKRTVFVPNGLDVVIPKKVKPKNETLRVLFLGALNEGKGVLNVIKSAALLRDQGYSLEFQLVGAWSSDEFRDEALKLVDSTQLGDAIHFPGVLKGESKWTAYAAADVFLFPSHYQSENFPLVIIEAMAFGLPIVSTRWRGIPQLVGDSGAAVLCSINSPEEYARELSELASDEVKRITMGEAAYKYYQENYTRQIFVESMERSFVSLLG